MKNFFRKLFGLKPRYRVKAWNTEKKFERLGRNWFRFDAANEGQGLIEGRLFKPNEMCN